MAKIISPSQDGKPDFGIHEKTYSREEWEGMTERQKHGLDLPDETKDETRFWTTVRFDDGTEYSASAPRAEMITADMWGEPPPPEPSPALKIVAGTETAEGSYGEAFHTVLVDLAKRFTGLEGKGIVCAYGQNPLTGKTIPGVVRHIPNDAEFVPAMLAAIDELAQLPHMNVYVFPGLVKLSVLPGERGKAEDVVCHGALVVDFDGQKHTPKSVAECLPLPSQYRVDTSPGNFQCWYMLDRSYTPKETEAARVALVRALKPFGVDTTHSADHVFRPAGVPNNPNKKKHDAGRKRELSRLSAGYLSSEPVTIAQLETALTAKYPNANAAPMVDPGSIDWEEPGLGQYRPIADAQAILNEWYPAGKRSQGAALFVDMAREHGWTPQQAADAMRGSTVAGRYGSDRAMLEDVARIWAKHKAKYSKAPQAPAVDPAAHKAALEKSTGYLGICLAQVQSERTEYLWLDRIPLGVLGTLAGVPKRGKSQMTAFLAAMATTGGTFPDGARCPKGSVIFISCEDDVAKTVKPRLEAAGADCSKVHIYEWTTVPTGKGSLKRLHFDVQEHAPSLENMIEAIGDVVMIVIDPISAYMGRADSHKTAEVRGALLPIMDLAKRYNLAVIMVNHFNKAQGVKSAMERVSGAGAFVAVSRWTFMIDFDPAEHEPDKRKRRRVMAPMGGNAVNDAEGFYFHIRTALTPNGIPTSRVEFAGGAVPLDADDIVAPPKAEKRLDAEQFIRDQLKEGPKLKSAVMAAGKLEGFTDITLKRASSSVRPRGWNDEKLGAWVWELRTGG